MTVYYYDLFTGTAGTLLTSHTADSGATWPNDADHYYGTGIVTLDGLGGVYQSNTGSSINLSSAAMPSTQNFEVLFSHIRKTSIAANAGLIFLSSPWPTIADCYELFYAEGDGWLLYHTSISGSTNTLLAGPYAGPAFGVTWYMRVDVSTSGGNTTFTVSNATAGTGPFTQLFSYTAATSSDLVAVGTCFYNPSTASTATTGQHIGALTVQDIPALSSATLSGPTQQLFRNPAAFTVVLNEPAGTGGVVVTLSSSNGSDTFQATQGGANVTSITLAAGQLNGMFWLTPGGATGNRTITITTSPTLTCPGSPLTYDALPAATGYTLTGSTGGHQLVPVTWTITLIGGDFAGTITATPGGGTGQCQIFSPALITFTGNGTLSKPFTFTPLDADSVTFTFTNSGSLTNPSPETYVSTSEYLVDAFVGTSGTAIQSHTSEILPSGVAGSTYTDPSVGAISLNGTGGVYMSTAAGYAGTGTAGPMSLSNAIMPTSLNCEFIFTLELESNIGNSAGTAVVLMHDSTVGTLAFGYWNTQIGWVLNASGWFATFSQPLSYPCTLQFKIDIQTKGSSIVLTCYYWNNDSWEICPFDNINPAPFSAADLPSAIAEGFLFAGTSNVASISNLTVQDMSPASPNCQISNAYVTSSGQSLMLFYETISGNTPVTPAGLNYAPSFFLNGTVVPAADINYWIGSGASCVGVLLPAGMQVYSTDVVTMLAPASAIALGTGNASAGISTPLVLTNNAPNVGALGSGKSCFGTDLLAKTFRPGANISYGGVLQHTTFNVFANLRYRLPTAAWNYGTANDGYPYSMASSPLLMDFYDFYDTNNIDATEGPGVPGYYAIGYDDLAHGTSNQTNLRLIPTNLNMWGSGQASIIANVASGAVTGFNVSSGGSAYPASSTTIPVSIYGTGCGARAVATSNSSGAITAVTLTAGGTGYTSAPTVLVGSSAASIVEPIATCNNPGLDGIGQFYLFNVESPAGSFVANVPISLQWSNAGLAPAIAKLYILGPGDFMVPSLTNTSWTFPRPAAPGPLSNQWLSNFANGAGCMRWDEVLLGFATAGNCNMCEPWEMHELNDFSWDNSNYVVSTINITTARALSSPYIYADQFGSSWTPKTSSGVAVTLGANITGLTAGSGTVSVRTGSSSVTFSATQNGLTGLAFIASGDATGTPNNLITGGSGTVWSLSTPYKGITKPAATWSTLQSTLTLSAVPQSGDAPFYGVMLQIDSEYMRCTGSSGTTVNVMRAQVFNQTPSTPAAHATGACITCYNRWPITGIPLSAPNTQWIEFLTESPHNFKACQTFTINGTLPTMTCTDGSTANGINLGALSSTVWPTGPSSFGMISQGTSTTGVTLGPSTAYPSAPTSYTLSGISIQNSLPCAGIPHEAVAIANGAIEGANIHVNLPLLASDSYCYNAAIKILNNFPAGRKVYLEIADEPWNWGSGIYYQTQVLSQFNAYSTMNTWYVVRGGQIRDIFRAAFGNRADEIYMGCNIWTTWAANQPVLPIAQEHNVIYDAYYIAPYISPIENSANWAAWNAATIPQMADLFIHDVYYNPANTTEYLGPVDGSVAGTHWAIINSYNAWMDANFPGTRHCILSGYEGGYSTGAPNGCTTCSSGVNEGMGGNGYGNICQYLNHDIAYDPVWRICEKDFYALLQEYGFSDLNTYSYNLYSFYQNEWGMYHWVGQQPGKGDGSDGKANNRLCLATPGYANSKASTTNQDQQNVSVRGQAILEWLQPMQDKKRMLFVPYRFVNR